ncbi:hypothetical protein [Mycoplasma sp. ATU-Cv-508]
MVKLEKILIPETINYHEVSNLASEARQKLSLIRRVLSVKLGG